MTPGRVRPAQLPNGVAKARSRAMSALVDSFGDAHAHLVGTLQRVVVVDRAADGRHLVGHTKCYAQARCLAALPWCSR